MMMMGRNGPTHTINGLQFEMLRVDARIPRMETQVWTFVNDSEVPHPVHALSIKALAPDFDGETYDKNYPQRIKDTIY